MQRFIFYTLAGWLLFNAPGLNGQDFLPAQEVDSSFVEKTSYDWTIRLVGNIKYQQLTIRDTDAKLKYRPVDPFAAGIGFSYKTLVVDFAVRMNSNTARETQRVDFRTSALLGPHLIDLSFLYYKGFEELTDNFTDPFRDDIRTVTMSLDYLYLPKVGKTSYMGTQTGLQFQKKSIGSPLVGGFIERHQVRADSSLVPSGDESDFSTENQFERFSSRSAGMLFGYAQFIRITDNFFGALILTTGIGAYWGQKWYVVGGEERAAGVLIQLNGYAALGYNWRRIYAIANYSLDARFAGFGDNQSYIYQLGRFKIALGYKLFKKNKV